MWLKIVISGVILVLVFRLFGAYQRAKPKWIGNKLKRHVTDIALRRSRFSTEEQMLIVIAHQQFTGENAKPENLEDVVMQAKILALLDHLGFVDRAGDWLIAQTLLLGAVLSFGFMLVEGLSWYLVVVPLASIGLLSAILSMLRHGPKGLGVRFGLVNIGISAILGAILLWTGSAKPMGEATFSYLLRWLWTPAGAFASAMLFFWLVLQIPYFFRRPWTYALRIAANRAFVLATILGMIWFARDEPFSKIIVFSAYGLLGLWLIIPSFCQKFNWPQFSSGLVLAALSGCAYWASENATLFDFMRPGIAERRASAEAYPSLWPAASRPSSRGCLETEDGKPIRVIAAGPNISMFKRKEMIYPADVAAVMKPWQRYYAFDKTEGAVLVGPDPNTPAGGRFWVYDSESYVLTNGLAITFKASCAIYSNYDDARRGKRPVEKRYQLPAELASNIIPVVQDVDGYLRFVRPDGVLWGFPLCWVKKDTAGIEIYKSTDP